MQACFLALESRVQLAWTSESGCMYDTPSCPPPQPTQKLPNFCICGQISHKSKQQLGLLSWYGKPRLQRWRCMDYSRGLPIPLPQPSLFLCLSLSLSIHPSPRISSSRGSARSPSGHITDIWTATGELTGDERVEEKQKEGTNSNIGALSPTNISLIVKRKF